MLADLERAWLRYQEIRHRLQHPNSRRTNCRGEPAPAYEDLRDELVQLAGIRLPA